MGRRTARFDEHAPERPGWEAALDAAVAEYRGHPGFGGYFVADEPVVGQFEDLGAIAARLRAQDPDHLAYINLLADYAAGGAGGASYRDYVERFITTVRPELLSYDYYPFGTSGDRGTFFTSLALMRELADAASSSVHAHRAGDAARRRTAIRPRASCDGRSFMRSPTARAASPTSRTGRPWTSSTPTP